MRWKPSGGIGPTMFSTLTNSLTFKIFPAALGSWGWNTGRPIFLPRPSDLRTFGGYYAVVVDVSTFVGERAIKLIIMVSCCGRNRVIQLMLPLLVFSVIIEVCIRVIDPRGDAMVVEPWSEVWNI